MRVFFLILVIIALFFISSKRNPFSIFAKGNNMADRFNQQAMKRDGSVRILESDGQSHLYFFHQDLEIEVYMVPSVKKPETIHLKCTIDSIRDYRVFIYKKTFAFDGGVTKATGESIIQTGNPDFTKLFIVESNEEEIVRKILTSEIQQYFIEQKKRRPVIHIKNGIFNFSIIGRPKDDQLDLFIETGLTMVNNLDDSN